MKTLVVGATGKYAGLVVPELKRRGATVRALIRSRDQEAEARRRGADEFVVGDLRDPASLRAALAGVDGVFHLNPAFSPDEAELGVGMVEAARSAGVEKFVFSGAIHPSISGDDQPRRQASRRGSALRVGVGFHRAPADHVHANDRQ